MAITRADADLVADRVWLRDGILPSPATAAPGNTHWTANSFLRDVHFRIRQVQTEQATMHVTIRTLAEALAKRDQAVDVDALVGRLRAELDRVTMRLTTED